MRSFLIIPFICCVNVVFAQKAWIEPEQINPDDSVSIFVDISKCDFQRLLNSTDPLYFWTWSPNELPSSDPNANGSWGASNEALKMTQISANVYRIKLVPTKFYKVSATTIYEKDFSFLIKKKDGSGLGGGGSNEDKTEDLKVLVDPPKQGPQKVRSFPQKTKKDTLSTNSSDVFTLIYDNNLEEKFAMIGKTDLYCFVLATGNNGTTYQIKSIVQAGTSPLLSMENKGNGIFHWQIIPNELFGNVIPSGITIRNLKIQIVRKIVSSSDDAVDGVFEFWFNSTCQ